MQNSQEQDDILNNPNEELTAAKASGIDGLKKFKTNNSGTYTFFTVYYCKGHESINQVQKQILSPNKIYEFLDGLHEKGFTVKAIYTDTRKIK